MCTLGLRLIVINVQCSTFFSNSEVFIRLYTLRVFAANNQFLSKHTRQPNSCFSENKQNCFELPTICVNPASWSHQSLWETARGKTHNLTLGVTKHCSPAQPSPSTVSWDWPYFQCEEREEKKTKLHVAQTGPQRIPNQFAFDKNKRCHESWSWGLWRLQQMGVC